MAFKKERELMKNINKIVIGLFVMLILSLGLTKIVQATTYAYLVGIDGKVVKINTDTNTIGTTSLTNTTYVQSGDTSVIGESINKRLFVEIGRLSSWIQVYDLSTLKFIQNLDIRTSEPDMYMFTSPDGNYLFIRWWNAALNNKQGDWEYDQYNVKTLTKIQSLPNFLFSNENMYSSDGSKIYVIRGGDVSEVDIYSASTFTSEGYVDLNPIFNKFQNVGHDIEDYRNGKLLIGANLASSYTVTAHIIFYTYNLDTATTSPILDVGSLRVKCKLSIDVSKYYCDEVQIVSDKYGHRYKSIGKLHIFDATTNKELGVINYPAYNSGSIIGIRPQGDYLYYLAKDTTGAQYLDVLNVSNISFVKTISVPDSIMFLVFDNE